MAEKITTRGKFDSELCGSLPVHRINLIQPYGYLLVLDRESLHIIQASENIEEISGLKASKLLNLPISQFIPKNDVDALKQVRDTTREDLPLTAVFTHKNKSSECTVLVHSADQYLLLEIEKGMGDDRSFLDVYQRIRYSMAAINKEDELEKACMAVVRELRDISRYQSVLMYRFDEDWNGTVIAEYNDTQKERYLGLKFPASDIPSQVRKLYLSNPYRYIPNRTYEPVRLYPVINPVDQSLLDLSSCNCRSVASVHLEYMQNMGLEASMSIRVVVNEQLWGLISCHHPVAKYLSYPQRSVFELLSGIISSKISEIVNRDSYKLTHELDSVRAKLIDQIYAGKDWRDNILYGDVDITRLLRSNGAAVIYDGRIDTIGDVPPTEDLENLIYWLQAKNVAQVEAIINLPEVNEEALRYSDIGSGIIVLPVNAEKGDFILGFRPEIIRTVSWGGNPYEAIQFEDDGKRYHPRGSFKEWIEIVKLTSKTWTKEEVTVAETFRVYLLEHLLKLSV
ncbi:MAG: GAF domain-containing protein [Mucilaginibacter polytrichastri]|nr:GAF domain-containing protein [Mucilaginibacter polytrichastri]